MLNSIEEESISLRNLIKRSHIYSMYLHYKESLSQMNEEFETANLQEFTLEEIINERVNNKLDLLSSKFK